MSRIACIMVADFSIAAIVRSNPAFADKVLAIGKSLAPHAELDAVSLRARELGIRSGMTIAQARAISSDLIVVHRSPAAESSAHSALLDAAESVSPVIESGAPGCAWVDLAGLQRIFNGEEEITAELLRCVRRVGMEPAAGVAANKELAHLAAQCGGVRVIEAGREREFLNWLPLDMLGLGKSDRGDDLETTLARWGMRRLGELARLNPDAVGTRLGRRGVELVRLARGGSHAPLVPRRRAEFFVETVELEYGIELLEPLGFVMRAMLERLADRLSLRGMVAGDITLAFGMSGHRSFNRQVEVAAPSNDVRAILTLINLSLEGAPPEAAVESIRIEIAPRVPRPAQTDMFLPPSPAPDKLQTTIARLAALCGPGNVGMLSAENSHRPEATRLDSFAPPAGPPIPENAPVKNVTQLVIRAIRPAREIEVMCSREIPEFVRGENLGARVISIAGPWRRDGEWWLGCTADAETHSDSSDKANPALKHGLELHDGRMFGAHPRQVSAENLKALSALTQAPSPTSHLNGTNGNGARSEMNGANKCGFIRDYYELALEDGGVYRVFRDANSHKWFLDGSYD
jgi:protein ImuB